MFSTHKFRALFACYPMAGEMATYDLSAKFCALVLSLRAFFKATAFCFLVFCFSLQSICADKPSDQDKNQTKADATQPAPQKSKTDSDLSKLRGFQEKIESRIVGKKDFKNCNRLLRKTKDENLRINLLIVLSRYERELNVKPQEALNLIAPEILAPEKLAEFHKKFPVSDPKAQDKKNPAQANPQAIVDSFPPSSELIINNKTALCIVELANIYLALQQTEKALDMADIVGRKFFDLPQVLASETSGDIMIESRLYEKSVSFYELALKFLDKYKYDSKENGKGLDLIKNRIAKKLDTARRLFDMERYGEGFVLYREAETKRLTDKSPAEAIRSYNILTALFPATVYSEAAKAYTIRCLFSLEDTEAQNFLIKRISEIENIIKSRKEILKDAEKYQVPEKVIKEFSAEISNLEEKLNGLKNTPTGKNAAELAEKKAESFIAENEFGLYRGEILVLLAERDFWKHLEPERAERSYVRAWKWLENTERLEDKLTFFDVPTKAAGISLPPFQEFKQDYFGNSNKTEIGPGKVVNRRTCTWYLNDLREQCLLAIGFLSFYKGDKEKAIKCYDTAMKYDDETKRLESTGEWNNVSRLKYGVELGYLNAYPEELDLYKDRLRFIVLVADFYYCTMRFGTAAKLAERMLAGEFGKLDKKQNDYPKYLIALCRNWDKDRTEAFKLCRELAEGKDWTLTKERASISAANLAMQAGNVEIMAEGLRILENLASLNKEDPFVHRARLSLGLRLIQLGSIDEGEKWLKKVPQGKDYESGYFVVAKQYLEKIDKLREVYKEKMEKRKMELKEKDKEKKIKEKEEMKK